MALNDNERAAIRLHLGYSNLDTGVAIGYGVAHTSEQYQALDLAMAELRADAEADVRKLIEQLDEIECQKQALAKTFATKRVEGIEFSGAEALMALNELKRDRGLQLADILAVSPNPYSAFWQTIDWGSGGGGVREGCL